MFTFAIEGVLSMNVCRLLLYAIRCLYPFQKACRKQCYRINYVQRCSIWESTRKENISIDTDLELSGILPHKSHLDTISGGGHWTEQRALAYSRGLYPELRKAVTKKKPSFPLKSLIQTPFGREFSNIKFKII